MRVCADDLLFAVFVQKLAQRSRIKSSALAVKSERLQQFPALKWELEEKDDLVAALAEELAMARESVTGSTSWHDDEVAQLKSKHPFLIVFA